MMKLKRKLVKRAENVKKRLSDKSGQGALDTAIICEPFLC